MTEPGAELDVPDVLTRGAHADRGSWLASARFLLDLLAATLGRDDLDGVELLDVGCGTKFTKVLLDEGRPIGRYVGVDVSGEVIGWLRDNVHDPRFEHHHLDATNDLYNPRGVPLVDVDALPVGGRRFDLISLFSVFTHLDPVDYVAMLHLLRPCAKPDGKLLFSVFLDGHSKERPLARALEERLAAGDPQALARIEAALVAAAASGLDPRFKDAIPDQPLLQARYATDYALELIEGTGWEVESVNPPVSPHVQHYIVCTPA